MKKKSGIISYRSCSFLVAAVFYLQFIISFSAKRLWSVLDAGTPHDFVYIIIAQIFAVGLPCLMMGLIEKADFKREFSFKKIKLKQILFCVLMGVSLQPVAMMANIPLQRLVVMLKGELPPLAAAAPQNGWQFVTSLVVICVVPAVFEELLVRGMLLNSVKKYGILKALVVTTVVFALLHNDVSSFVGLVVLGLAGGFAVLMTGSVFAGILVHLAFNATGVLLDFFMNVYSQINSAGFVSLFASMGIVAGIFAVYGIYNKKEVQFMCNNAVERNWVSFFNVPIILVVAGYVFGGLL